MDNPAFLITGGSGFIGRALIRSLAEAYPSSTIVNADLVPGGPESHFVEWDVRDPAPIHQLDKFDFGCCIHLAALAVEPAFPNLAYFETNDLGTTNVLQACTALGIDKVVFTSTMMVFSPSDDARNESDAVDPTTAYGASKALAERSVSQWSGAKPERSATTLRPGVVFGPGDRGNFERLRGLLARNRFVYVGRKSTVKAWIHVEDLVGIILHASRDLFEEDLLHCALGGPTRMDEIVTAIDRSFGYASRPPTLPYRLLWCLSFGGEALAAAGVPNPVHHRRIEKLYCSTNLAADRLRRSGWTPKYPTIDSAVHAWARSHEPENASARKPTFRKTRSQSEPAAG